VLIDLKYLHTGRVIICYRCRGTGMRLDVPNREADLTIDNRTVSVIPCEFCNTTGRLVVSLEPFNKNALEKPDKQ
jgi:RecJ-like exonuclease